MSQSLDSYLLISTILFSLGVFGLLSRKNLIAILISLELILNSANINFVAFSKFCSFGPEVGQTFAIFVIALAAAEVCIGLSIILLLSRRKNSIELEKLEDLKG